jgi:hypothetical protein
LDEDPAEACRRWWRLCTDAGSQLEDDCSNPDPRRHGGRLEKRKDGSQVTKELLSWEKYGLEP